MPKADRNSEGDVRDALMPLQLLMEQTGVAVLGIMHVGKADAQRRAAQRLLGSTAFTALARCVWMVHELPEEFQPELVANDPTIGRRKALGVVKANYSMKPPALAWSQPASAVLAAAKSHEPSIGEKTLRTAANRIGVEKVKADYQGQSLWSLPRSGGEPITESTKDGKHGNSSSTGHTAKFEVDAGRRLGTIPIDTPTAKIATFRDSRDTQSPGGGRVKV